MVRPTACAGGFAPIRRNAAGGGKSHYATGGTAAKPPPSIEAGALEIARTTVISDSRRSYLGIILGFIIAMTGLLGGIFLIAIGRGGFGLTLGLASLVGLVAVFVYGAQSRRAERRRNAANPEGAA